ncbi:hypothetical protein [Labrys neptuniae]
MRASTGFLVLLAIGCAMLVFFETQGQVAARLIDGFSPCRQNPAYSAPCYTPLSLAIAFTAAATGLAALAAVLVRALMARQPRTGI